MGETLSIVLSDTFKIFGGYTPIPWERGEDVGKNSRDFSSFLFSVRDDDTITKLPNSKVSYEVIHDKKKLVNFCVDLEILPNCDKDHSSFSYVINYDLPDSLNLAKNCKERLYYLNHGQ